MCLLSLSPGGGAVETLSLLPERRQTSSSQWSLPSPETDCVVYCNIIILYYYIALLLDYTCSFIFISRNNKECVYSRCCDFIFIYIHTSQIKRNNRVLFIFNQLDKIHVLRFVQHPSTKKVPDNMPFKSL